MIPEQLTKFLTEQEQAIQEIVTQLPSLVGGSIENLRGIIKNNGKIKKGELGLLLITGLLLTPGCGTADNGVLEPVLATSTPITAPAIETPISLVQITPTTTITKLPNLTTTPTEVPPTPTKLTVAPTPVPSPTVEVKPTPNPRPTPDTFNLPDGHSPIQIYSNVGVIRQGVTLNIGVEGLKILAEKDGYLQLRNPNNNSIFWVKAADVNQYILGALPETQPTAPPSRPHSHEPLLTLDRPGRANTQVKDLIYWREDKFLGPQELPLLPRSLNLAARVESVNLNDNTFIANFGGGKKVKIFWSGDNTQDSLSCILVRFNPSYLETVEGATLGGDIKDGDVVFWPEQYIGPALNQIDPNKGNVPVSTQYAAILQK